MGHRSVVEDAAEEVHEHRDHDDESEDAAWADATGLMWLCVGACVRGSDLKEIGAFVWVCADKGDAGRGRGWVSIAVERNGRRLASSLVLWLRFLLSGLLGFRNGRVSRQVVLILEVRVALGGSFVDRFRLVDVGAARRAPCVLKNQLATTAL